MAISRAQLAKELEPGLNALFGMEYARYDNEAAEIYANLQKKGKLIEDADILIASSAKMWDFTLVSDDSDFRRVHGLRIENWLT